MKKQSKANLTPKRQRTQYSCMATSMSMCLQALDYPHATEDEVNKVMGALPMQGAAWEQALACAQHYGCRATLTMPSTVKQLKEWTDRGIPVMIAWNPEGRDWSHASVVFDVDEDLNVYVADPNIPDPDETVRVVPKTEFYSKWYEKWPNYLVRRPACAIEREITPDGRQIMASKKENKMSRKQELAKIAREIKSIKLQLQSKTAANQKVKETPWKKETPFKFKPPEYTKEFVRGNEFPYVVLTIEYSSGSSRHHTPEGWGLSMWVGHPSGGLDQGNLWFMSPTGRVRQATIVDAAGSEFLFRTPEEAKKAAPSFIRWAQKKFPMAFEQGKKLEKYLGTGYHWDI